VKIQMRMVDILVRLKCPRCGTIRDLNKYPVMLQDMECLECRDREKKPDYGKIWRLTQEMEHMLDEIEAEIEEVR